MQISLECCRTDDQADIIIYGVESEQVEEENDALNDMRYELGESGQCLDGICSHQLAVTDVIRNTQRCRGRLGGVDALVLCSECAGLLVHEPLKLLQN